MWIYLAIHGLRDLLQLLVHRREDYLSHNIGLEINLMVVKLIYVS